MVRDLPENDRDDEIVDETTEPTPPEGETPTLGPNSGDDAFAAENDLGPDVGPELTPDVPSAELGGDAAAAESPTLPPSEAAAPESVTDSAVAADSSTPGEPPSQSPPVSTKTDWSNFVPAPGYADPETGRPVFRTGRVDQAGMEVMLLVHGLRPNFDPESDESSVDPATPPPRDDGVPPFVPGNKPDGGASPSVSVDVRVSFTPEAIELVSKGTIRKAAEFSRAELLVVAQNLFELDQEIKAREQQRRVLARQY